MLSEFDTVRIKGTGITGTIIDIHENASKTMCYIDTNSAVLMGSTAMMQTGICTIVPLTT